jgi:hypothetical protein
MASVEFLSCGPSPFGSEVAMKRASEPAQSGLPVVLSCTILVSREYCCGWTRTLCKLRYREGANGCAQGIVTECESKQMS